MPKEYPNRIQKAFDEIRFGAARTLNLRESLPTADQARARAESWVRTKQVERAGELLVITGRGQASDDGIAVVRKAILALFPSLRRRNIITKWEEHTAGSFVVTLAPVSAMFEAPKRRREKDVPLNSPLLLRMRKIRNWNFALRFSTPSTNWTNLNETLEICCDRSCDIARRYRGCVRTIPINNSRIRQLAGAATARARSQGRKPRVTFGSAIAVSRTFQRTAHGRYSRAGEDARCLRE